MFVGQLPERVTGVDSNETLLGRSVSAEYGQLALGVVNQRVRLCARGRSLEKTESQSLTATAGTQGETGQEDHAESDGPVHRCAAHETPVQLSPSRF